MVFLILDYLVCVDVIGDSVLFFNWKLLVQFIHQHFLKIRCENLKIKLIIGWFYFCKNWQNGKRFLVNVILEYFLHKFNKIDNQAASRMFEGIDVKDKQDLDILGDLKDLFVNQCFYIFYHIAITIVDTCNVYPHAIFLRINVFNKIWDKCVRFCA